jgi:hypothetical protein
MNFSEILTFVRQRIKKLPESPFLHTYIYILSPKNDKQSVSITKKDLLSKIDSIKFYAWKLHLHCERD